MSEDLLDPNGSSEPEASNDHDDVHNHCSSIETYAGERSNQHNVVNEDEGSNLSSNFINAEVAIPKVLLRLKEVSTERNGPKEFKRVQNLYITIEQDEESCNSTLTNYDETVPIERSNQHNIVDAAEGFKLPSNLEYLVDGDLIPTELLYDDGSSLHEPKATNNSNWTQNQYITYTKDGVMMESYDSMEKSSKRPRLHYDGLNHHVKNGEAQPWGEEYPSCSKSIQADSYNRMVTPQIGGSITYQ